MYFGSINLTYSIHSIPKTSSYRKKQHQNMVSKPPQTTIEAENEPLEKETDRTWEILIFSFHTKDSKALEKGDRISVVDVMFVQWIYVIACRSVPQGSFKYINWWTKVICPYYELTKNSTLLRNHMSGVWHQETVRFKRGYRSCITKIHQQISGNFPIFHHFVGLPTNM